MTHNRPNVNSMFILQLPSFWIVPGNTDWQKQFVLILISNYTEYDRLPPVLPFNDTVSSRFVSCVI